MQLSIYRSGILIGTGRLDRLDPPMGFATGPFFPSDQYDPGCDANTIDGVYFGDRGAALSAVGLEHGTLKASVVIEDFAKTLSERALWVQFEDGLTFRGLFADHADYRAYYNQ